MLVEVPIQNNKFTFPIGMERTPHSEILFPSSFTHSDTTIMAIHLESGLITKDHVIPVTRLPMFVIPGLLQTSLVMHSLELRLHQGSPSA